MQQGPTADRKRKRETATRTAATAHAKSAKAGAIPGKGQEGLYMCSCYSVRVCVKMRNRSTCFITECREGGRDGVFAMPAPRDQNREGSVRW